MQNHWLFSSNNIYFCKCQKADEIKKKQRERENFGRIKFGSSPVRKQNVSYYKPVTLNKLNCSCFRHIINILLTELSRSVLENLDLGRVYRPHCVRSVLTTSVKILPYRPPARLIRAKYCSSWYFDLCLCSCPFHLLWVIQSKLGPKQLKPCHRTWSEIMSLLCMSNRFIDRSFIHVAF